MTEEDFELIPVSPLRRLEKRIEKLETFSGDDPKSIMKDVIEIIRMNQQIVDELARSNDALRIELSKLPARIEELTSQMKELIMFIKSAGEEEITTVNQESMKPLIEKLDELVKTNKTIGEKNEAMLSLLDEIGKRVKKPAMPVRRLTGPLLPVRPLRRP